MANPPSKPVPAAAARAAPPTPTATLASTPQEFGKFICSAQPENSLAYTNHIFVSPEDEKQFGFKPEATNFVALNGKYFIVRAHKGMSNGRIGLNRLQRVSCGLADGDIVVPEKWVVPPNHTLEDGTSLHLHAVRLEFEVFGSGTKRIDFKEDEMVPVLREALHGQVLCKDQQVWARFASLTLVVRVAGMDAPVKQDQKSDSKTRGHVTRNVQFGIINGSTKIKMSVKAEAAKFITLEESDERPPLFDPERSFQDMGIGGLDEEFGAIFRRAFASRVFPAQVIEELGIKHVKGMLLFGPPGTGKTLIARQIGKMLRGREPKIVNGPEILNKFVGQSEENIRNLFKDAEAEYSDKKEKSSLHVIIFDEIDAICKQRGTMTGSTGVHDTIVNQLLSKIDGVNSLNNILVIGMTNRKDMIDQALLRPGRLEVHVEIGLPDEKGREQILMIHTKKMRDSNRLDSDVDIPKLAHLTKNFSGAELEGLVKSASSFALNRSVDISKGSVETKTDVEGIVVTMDDFMRALDEVLPAFGAAEDELKALVRGELIAYSPEFSRLLKLGQTWLKQVESSPKTPLLSVLLEGAAGCGKTALAAHLGLKSGFPFTKVISPENFIGYSEPSKCAAISKVFEDAYKSPLSMIILDNIERLLDYVPIGPRFSNQVLQTLLVLLKRLPTHEGRKLLILATTSSLSILKDMEFKHVFNVISHVPLVERPEHVIKVFQSSEVKIDEKELVALANQCPLPVGIKQLMMFIEMAKVAGQSMTAARFMEIVRDCGFLEQVRKKQLEEEMLLEGLVNAGKDKETESKSNDDDSFAGAGQAESKPK